MLQHTDTRHSSNYKDTLTFCSHESLVISFAIDVSVQEGRPERFAVLAALAYLPHTSAAEASKKLCSIPWSDFLYVHG